MFKTLYKTRNLISITKQFNIRDKEMRICLIMAKKVKIYFAFAYYTNMKTRIKLWLIFLTWMKIASLELNKRKHKLFTEE